MIRKTIKYKERVRKVGIFEYTERYLKHTIWVLIVPIFSYEEIVGYEKSLSR